MKLSSRSVVQALSLLIILSVLLSSVPAQFALADTNYALQFDGNNDYVLLAQTANIFGAGWESNKSVELWVRPEGMSPTCQYPDPVWCDAVFGDRPRWWGISRGVINGLDRLWVWNWDTTGMDVIAIEYALDEWAHIALVHSDGILRAYKNGIEVGNKPSGPTQQAHCRFYSSAVSSITHPATGPSRGRSMKCACGISPVPLRIWHPSAVKNLLALKPDWLLTTKCRMAAVSP